MNGSDLIYRHLALSLNQEVITTGVCLLKK